MKNAALTAMLMTAILAIAARAQSVPQLMSDPLSQQILTKTSQQNGGVTAAVRSGTGQVVVLHLADVSSTFGASLAPAAGSANVALKPAAGLNPKTAKRGKVRRQPRRAVEQLRGITRAHAKNW